MQNTINHEDKESRENDEAGDEDRDKDKEKDKYEDKDRGKDKDKDKIRTKTGVTTMWKSRSAIGSWQDLSQLQYFFRQG